MLSLDNAKLQLARSFNYPEGYEIQLRQQMANTADSASLRKLSQLVDKWTDMLSQAEPYAAKNLPEVLAFSSLLDNKQLKGAERVLDTAMSSYRSVITKDPDSLFASQLRASFVASIQNAPGFSNKLFKFAEEYPEFNTLAFKEKIVKFSYDLNLKKTVLDSLAKEAGRSEDTPSWQCWNDVPDDLSIMIEKIEIPGAWLGDDPIDSYITDEEELKGQLKLIQNLKNWIKGDTTLGNYLRIPEPAHS